jgi:hypothetical protein
MRCSVGTSLHVSEPVVSTDHLAAPVLGRSGCPTERAGRSQGRPLFQRGDVCCMQQQTGEFCADPFLRFRQCGSCRQARALDAAILRLARQGGRKVETSRATVARGERASWAEKRTGEASDLRAREKVRERAGVAGGARVRRISRPGDRTVEHTGKRRRRYGRAGVHTGNAWKQTRRQRLGEARRSADTHGNARCIPVFWVWGGR